MGIAVGTNNRAGWLRVLAAALPGLLLPIAAATSAGAAAPLAYVTNLGSGTVSVIDTACNSIVVGSGAVKVGDAPNGVAVNPAGTRVYVANTDSRNVSVIDTATNSVTATVDVGTRPYGVAVNPEGTRVYVTTGNLVVIDAATNTVVASVPGAGTGGVAVNPAGTRIYVSTAFAQTLTVVDAASNTVIATVPMGDGGAGVGWGGPGVAINPAGSRVYVANETTGSASGAGSTVSVFDTATDTLTATVAVGLYPHGVAVSPDGTRVYVASRAFGRTSLFGAVSVIDAATNTAIDTVTLGDTVYPREVAINSTGTRIYVASQNVVGSDSFGTVSVIDTATNTVIENVYVGKDPVGVAVAPAKPAPGPGPSPTERLRVTGLEVTQGIQDLTNRVPLVSGRRTFVRVYARSEGAAVLGATASLSGLGTYCTLAGCVDNPLGSLIPVNTVGPRILVNPSPPRNDLNASFLFELPWTWTQYRSVRLLPALTAEPGPPPQACPSDVRAAPIHEFRPAMALKLQFVQLAYRLPSSFNGLINQFVGATSLEQTQSESFIRRTYPLSNLLSGPAYVLYDAELGRYVNQSAALCLDMEAKDRNQCAHSYITGRLAALQASSGFMGDAEGAYALIPQVPNDPTSIFFTRGACCNNRIGSGPSNVADYAAHEMMHLLGRAHPKEGAAKCNHTADDAAYPYSLSFIGPGALGLAELAGFDGGDASLGIPKSFLDDHAAYDNIGYCKPSWISDYTYEALFCMLAFPRNNPDATVHPTVCGLPRPGLGAAGPLSGDWLMVFGSVDPDLGTAALRRIQRVDQIFGEPPRIPGTHSIRLLGAAGVVLADYPFTPEVIEDAEKTGGSPKPLDFGQVVPFIAGTQQIQIVDASTGERVIAAKTVSSTPPAVSNVVLQGMPDPATGAVTVGWTASDADGDPITFDIFLTRAGRAELQPLTLGLSDTSAQISTASLGGGSARLHVVATDGVHSSAADSPPFTLADKPPRPRILMPGDGTTVYAGQLVNLEGEAIDPQDGALTGASLIWSTPSGVLGDGTRVSVTDLPVGVNRITLTATNSLGLAAATVASIIVNESVDQPGPTLTAGPTRIGWQVGVGEVQPQTATLNVGNGGSGTLQFSARSTAPWLTLDTSVGTAPATITLTGNPSGFDGGVTAEAEVTLTASGLPGQVITVPVRLAVGNTFTLGVRAPAARPVPGDLDGDSDVDLNDLTILLRDRNKSVGSSACGVQCDLDADGIVTVLDGRRLQLLCTRPRCATQ